MGMSVGRITFGPSSAAYTPLPPLPPKIHAPFSDEQVEGLRRWQTCGYVHEFTCCKHVTMDVETRGFVCPECGRVQTWAHAFMVNPPPDPFALIRAEL